MNYKLPHLELKGYYQEIEYQCRGGGKDLFPQKSQETHGRFLINQYEKAWNTACEKANSITQLGVTREGVYIQFNFDSDYDKYITKLDRRNDKIRLCCFHQYKDVSTAIYFIPNKKQERICNLIKKYQNPEFNTNSGNPSSAALMSSITDIVCPELKNFWQDDISLMPDNSQKWVELWIREEFDSKKQKSSHGSVEEQMIKLLDFLNISHSSYTLHFPERTVIQILANRNDLENIIQYSDDIAEMRIAKTTSQFWLSLSPSEQTEWVNDMADRVCIDINVNNPVCVCILDTGVNRSHPLLEKVLYPEDCQTCEKDWGTHDTDLKGHGTAMAGLVTYGNMSSALENRSPIIINHILESVKILPPPFMPKTPPELWGAITSQAVSLAEIQAPTRKRIICSAVTSDLTNDRGRPSSWSAEIDKIAFARLSENENKSDTTKRLFILAAGNVDGTENNYPDAQINSPIQDPNQSWNAITIGAFTQLCTLTDPSLSGLQIVAQPNQLSPFSCTSFLWDDRWPIKPEVVFEGGNQYIRNNSTFDCDDLSLTSTNHDFQNSGMLCNFCMTSAAAALGANFAAKIQHQYPHFWAETVRALMVHSAEWTRELREQFCNSDRQTEKRNLMRACGYGVPNLNKALYSASNSLTLIAQSEIQPFIQGDKTNKLNKMHYYQLPWPKDALDSLGEKTVKMRITLSYFIEPAPGSIGWNNRYRYPSYGLRFDLKRAEESSLEFQKRINMLQDEKSGESSSNRASHSYNKHWTIGPSLRDRGSIHSDTWTSSAAELRDCNEIIITPVAGWWKYRKHLKMGESKTRYSLIVSLYTEELNLDIELYSPVLELIQQVVQSPIQ